MKILVPYAALLSVTSITNTPVTYGSIVATQELRCALDTDPMNYTTWWSGNYDQPIIFRYSSMTLPFTIASGTGAGQGCSAFWVVIQNSAFTALSGNYNSLSYIASADGSSWSGLTIDKHGDGIDTGSAIELSTPPTDSQGYLCNGSILYYYTSGLSAVAWHKAGFSTGGGHAGGNYQLFEIMHGVLLNVPGELRDAKEYSREHYSAYNSASPYGKLQFGGHKSAASKKSVTYTYGALSLANMTLMNNVVKYCRGMFPVLIAEDTSSRDSWYKAILRGIDFREPDAGDYWFDLHCEEC